MVMRPYQIYAVKAAMKRVLEANRDGYVFACTGSGKTLTSFKLAQLLRNENRVEKVIFLIDRKDLDDQTIDEYNSFEKDCVDRTDKTSVLIKQLKEKDRKLIVTTIQKLAIAVRNSKYSALMDSYRTQKVVFIIDECHRSQFGKMHADIKNILPMQIISDSPAHLFLRQIKVLTVVQQRIFSMQERWMLVYISI